MSSATFAPLGCHRRSQKPQSPPLACSDVFDSETIIDRAQSDLRGTFGVNTQKTSIVPRMPTIWRSKRGPGQLSRRGRERAAKETDDRRYDFDAVRD